MIFSSEMGESSSFQVQFSASIHIAFVIVDLGCEIEAQMAVILNAVFNHHRNLKFKILWLIYQICQLICSWNIRHISIIINSACQEKIFLNT